MSESMNQYARYHRQMLLPGVGRAGQARLAASHALIVGCGALGSASADALARAGVGTITIVDRDIVELTNLQRQMLYTEADAQQAVPKAIAAAGALRAINSTIEIRAHVDDFNASNAAQYAHAADVIIDGLDNFETRYLLNDLAVSRSTPYVYGGAVATTGMGLVVLPAAMSSEQSEAPTERAMASSAQQATPCLRCVFPEPPPPGMSATCDTAGVLGPAVTIIAAWQATQALKLLIGALDAIDRRMLSIDVWSNHWRTFDVSSAGPSAACPCCGQRDFAYLRSDHASRATAMCGRDGVQVMPSARSAMRLVASESTSSDSNHDSLDLQSLAARLAEHGSFHANQHMLRGTLTAERCDTPSAEAGRAADDDAAPRAIELTVFPNGRAIIKGTSDPARARSIYSKYIGL